MLQFKRLFMEYMDEQGIKYTDTREDVVKISYNGDNLRSIHVYVFFDKDGDPLVSFKCWEIANFKDKEARALVACNDLNKQYRWVKFYIDSDADIIAEMDAIIDVETCGQECLSLVRRMVNIVDEGYPTLGKALWA